MDQVDEEEFVFESELSKLTGVLNQLPQQQLPQIFQQFHQILQGTHSLVKILDPDEVTDKKGRPTLQKAKSSQKRIPCNFEIVEKEWDQAQKEKESADNKRGKSEKNKPRKKARLNPYLDLEAVESEDEESISLEEEDEDEDSEQQSEEQDPQETTVSISEYFTFCPFPLRGFSSW